MALGKTMEGGEKAKGVNNYYESGRLAGGPGKGFWIDFGEINSASL